MMHRVHTGCLWCAALTLLLLAACSGPPPVPPSAADGTTSLPTGTPDVAGSIESMEEFDTLEEGDMEVVAVPLELTKAQERGLMIFRHYCAHCHGVNGEGDGQNSYGLETPPRDLLTLELDGLRTDQELRVTIGKGGAASNFSPLMPPWGHTLEPQRIDDLLAAIHILPELEIPEEEIPILDMDDESGKDDFSL